MYINISIIIYVFVHLYISINIIFIYLFYFVFVFVYSVYVCLCLHMYMCICRGQGSCLMFSVALHISFEVGFLTEHKFTNWLNWLPTGWTPEVFRFLLSPLHAHLPHPVFDIDAGHPSSGLYACIAGTLQFDHFSSLFYYFMRVIKGPKLMQC